MTVVHIVLLAITISIYGVEDACTAYTIYIHFAIRKQSKHAVITTSVYCGSSAACTRNLDDSLTNLLCAGEGSQQFGRTVELLVRVRYLVKHGP